MVIYKEIVEWQRISNIEPVNIEITNKKIDLCLK